MDEARKGRATGKGKGRAVSNSAGKNKTSGVQVDRMGPPRHDTGGTG